MNSNNKTFSCRSRSNNYDSISFGELIYATLKRNYKNLINSFQSIAQYYSNPMNAILINVIQHSALFVVPAVVDLVE